MPRPKKSPFKRKKNKKCIADINLSNKFLSKKWSKEQLDNYLSALSSSEEKVVEVIEAETCTKYFVEFKNGGKAPVLCPKCHTGEVALMEFECTNQNNPKDILHLSLLRCTNLADNCDFVSNESITKLTNKFLEKARARAEKISAAADNKRERFEHLEKEVEENSLWNILKAVFKKSPRSVGSAFAVLLLSVATSLVIAGNALFGGGNTEFKAGGENLNFEYRYAAPEIQEIAPSAHSCQEYMEANYLQVCMGYSKQEIDIIERFL